MNTTYTASASVFVIAVLVERLMIAIPLIPPATDRLLRITPLAERAGLRIEGELDRSTLPALRRALASLTSGDGDCYVDLSGLKFIDVGCLRVLVGAAVAIHDGGGDHVLRLCSVPPQMRRLLELTDWLQVPGLHLQASARPD